MNRTTDVRYTQGGWLVRYVRVRYVHDSVVYSPLPNSSIWPQVETKVVQERLSKYTISVNYDLSILTFQGSSFDFVNSPAAMTSTDLKRDKT